MRLMIQFFKDNVMFCHDSYHGQFNLKLNIYGQLSYINNHILIISDYGMIKRNITTPVSMRCGRIPECGISVKVTFSKS